MRLLVVTNIQSLPGVQLLQDLTPVGPKTTAAIFSSVKEISGRVKTAVVCGGKDAGWEVYGRIHQS